MYSISRLLAVAILVSLFLQAPVFGARAVSGESDINNIVVCNVYNEDSKAVNLQSPRISKFVVTFGSIVNPERIQSIHVKGPDDYRFNLNIGLYTSKNLNGYKRTGPYIWFMGFDRRGFLKNGRYDITLTYKSGRTTSKGRVLKYTNKLLEAYLKTKPKFSPTGALPADTDLSRITLKWTVIPGVQAYYMTRLGRGNAVGRARQGNSGWIFKDTIFGRPGNGNPLNTGLNKGALKVGITLGPGQRYRWFTEILDSNNLNEVNIAIFLKQQFFSTPKQRPVPPAATPIPPKSNTIKTKMKNPGATGS